MSREVLHIVSVSLGHVLFLIPDEDEFRVAIGANVQEAQALKDDFLRARRGPLGEPLLRGPSHEAAGYFYGITMSNAGEHLRYHENSLLLRELIRVVEDEEEEQIDRLEAYRALARAVGHAEVPDSLNLFAGTTPAALLEAKERLVERGG